MREQKADSGKRVLCCLLSAFCFLLFACQAPATPAPPRRSVPRVRATTLVVRTNLLPEQKAFQHLVILSNGKARIGNELDRWRLFDLQNNTVTFVDEIAGSYETETFFSLARKKRQQLGDELPESIPRAEFVTPGHQRNFEPYHAALSLIRMGGYQRSLWMSTDVPVPDQLFPLMVVSDPLSTAYSPVMAQAFDGMLELKGFPVLDRSDITYGGEHRVVEKRLVGVESRMVPASWLEIPADFQNLTPKPAERRAPPLQRALERLTR